MGARSEPAGAAGGERPGRGRTVERPGAHAADGGAGGAAGIATREREKGRTLLFGGNMAVIAHDCAEVIHMNLHLNCVCGLQLLCVPGGGECCFRACCRW